LNLNCQHESPMLGRGEGKVDIGLYSGSYSTESSTPSTNSNSK